MQTGTAGPSLEPLLLRGDTVADNSAWISDVTGATFEKEVIERSREVPVVVDFWSPWCGPCRMLGPILERLVNERAGSVHLVKVNVDDEQELAAAFRIEGIPAVKAVRDGQIVLQFEGLLPEPQLRDFLDRIVPSEADKFAVQAAELEATDPAAAERLFEMALVQNCEQQQALVGLARLKLARGQDAEAVALLDRAIPGGEQASEVDRLRGIMALRERARDFGPEAPLREKLNANPTAAELHYQMGCVLAGSERYRDAMEEMLLAAGADRKLAQGPVKETMVQIFHIVGVRSELAEEFRDKLTRLLY